jgi:hypothetical protein
MGNNTLKIDDEFEEVATHTEPSPRLPERPRRTLAPTGPGDPCQRSVALS